MDEEKGADAAERMLKNQFTLEDMLSQLTEVRKMGSIQDLLGMIPARAGNWPIPRSTKRPWTARSPYCAR
jgi:signal recognition particle GTPase